MRWTDALFVWLFVYCCFSSVLLFREKSPSFVVDFVIFVWGFLGPNLNSLSLILYNTTNAIFLPPILPLKVVFEVRYLCLVYI